MKGVVTAKDEFAIDHAHYRDPSFSATLVGWQKQHGRHTLPWQNTQDAYRVWLSEIMLQQTQVSTVIPYYQRFLQSFPDVFSLARASSEEVMSHWSGLGYYTRARNLHRCAQAVVEQYAGKFPNDPDKLAELPGIGRSTAAAIAAFSYGYRAAILDGNVKRVFTRIFGISGYPGSKPVEDQLWLRAAALLPESDIESYTQGLMDLGATICTRSSPACGKCPFEARCVAKKTNRITELPEKKPKKAVPEKQTMMLVVIQDGQVLLEQRPNSGIWGGLLSLPELAAEDDMDVFAVQTNDWLNQFSGVLKERQRLSSFMHVFTHFKLTIHPVVLYAEHVKTHVPYQWLDLQRINQAPLPAPVKKILQGLHQPHDLFSA